MAAKKGNMKIIELTTFRWARDQMKKWDGNIPTSLRGFRVPICIETLMFTRWQNDNPVISIEFTYAHRVPLHPQDCTSIVWWLEGWVSINRDKLGIAFPNISLRPIEGGRRFLIRYSLNSKQKFAEHAVCVVKNLTDCLGVSDKVWLRSGELLQQPFVRIDGGLQQLDYYLKKKHALY